MITGNGARRRIVGQFARGLEAIDARHHDVHQDQVGLQFARQAQAFAAVDGGCGAEAVLLERLLHDVNVGRRIVHDQYQCHDESSAGRAQAR